MLNKIKIGPKLIGGFLLVSIIAAGMAIFGVINMKQADDRDTMLYEKGAAPFEYLVEVAAYFQQLEPQLLAAIERAPLGSGSAGDSVRPAWASCSIAVTVSRASGLLVPMTPVAPRLIHPVVYSPTRGCLVSGSSTRPFSFRITPHRSWKGTPGSGTPR